MVVLLGIGLTSMVRGTLPTADHHAARRARTRQRGQRPAHGRDALRRAARVRVRRRGGHRRRGDLQRRARVPQAGVEERPLDARRHGHAARRDVPRPLGARGAHEGRAVRRRHADRDLADRRPRRTGRPRSGASSSTRCRPARCSSSCSRRTRASPTSRGSRASTRATTSCPRQLTKRGHRLVFSNGIIFLSAFSIVLVIVTGAKVDRLIPLYAIGVFTSFTLSQAGMAKHHLREREPGWRRGLLINGIGAFLSLVVDLIIAVTKFTHGAWLVIVLVPIMVVFLVRLAKQYATEAEQLEADVPKAVAAPILKRHVVLVFVDRLDLASARAIQYAAHADARRAARRALRARRARRRRARGGLARATAWRRSSSTSSTAPTAASPARRSRPSRATSPTARPRSACCCPSASTPASGTASSTTRPPTRSCARSRGCRTRTSRPCRSTSTGTGADVRPRRPSRSIVTPRRSAHGGRGRRAAPARLPAHAPERNGRHAHRRGAAAPARVRAGPGPDVAGPAARGDLDARVRASPTPPARCRSCSWAGPASKASGSGRRMRVTGHRGRPPRPARDPEPGLRPELRRRRTAIVTPDDELALAWAGVLRPRPHPRVDGTRRLRSRVRTGRGAARARPGRRVGPPHGACRRTRAVDPGREQRRALHVVGNDSRDARAARGVATGRADRSR